MAYGPHHATTEILSQHHTSKAHLSAQININKATVSSENPENLCLKSPQYTPSQIPSVDITKPPGHQSYHQNYDVFSTLYNTTHHLNYHGAHLSLQQYLGVGAHGGSVMGGGLQSHHASVHLGLDQQTQHDYQHSHQVQSNPNWNVSRYYHQNQVNYDG